MGGYILTLAEETDDANSLPWLPVQRWSDNIGGLTSRVDDPSLFNPTSWFKAVPSNIEGIFLNIGNNLWGAAAWFESQSESSTSGIVETFGKMANKFTGAVWSSLADWYILAIAIMVTIVFALWRYVHNGTLQAFGQRMVALVLGLALFAGMGIASANHPDEAYTGTPYWLVKETRNVINDAGGGVANAIVEGFDDRNVFLASSKTEDALSCRNYLVRLHEKRDEAVKANNMSADTILTSLNTMWEETGLRIWARAQYGTGDNSMQVFCRIPEYRAGVTADTMKTLTQTSIDKAGGNGYVLNTQALAFNPASWNPDTDGGKSTTSNLDIVLDRWVVMWDVCGFKNGKVTYRNGWKWVNGIRGEDRGVDQNGRKASSGVELVQQCAAALTGSTAINATEQQSVDHPLNEKLLVDKEELTDKGDPTSPDDRKALINKFNLKTGTWEEVAQTRTLVNGGDVSKANNASVQTLHQQQGEVSVSDVGGSIVFAISAIINLLIWGIGFGLVKMFTLAIACLVAAGGLWLGLLFYAFSPDKGKRAVVNAAKHTVGMTAAGTVLGLVASTGCTFVVAGMGALGLLNDDGNTAGTVMMLSVASAVLPVIYLWSVKYVCVNIWKVGDPFSGEGLFRMIGGQAIVNGLKTLGGMTVGGMAGAIGAAVGGAGFKGVLGAAAHGMGLDRPHGAVGRAIGMGVQAKDRAEYRRAMGMDGGSKHAGSEADRAAVDHDESEPSREEYASAVDEVRGKRADELKAQGLEGDELEAALDEYMDSDTAKHEVDLLAAGRHGEAEARRREAEPTREEREDAWREEYARHAKELKAKGLRGRRLRQAMDSYMDSDMGRHAVGALAEEKHRLNNVEAEKDTPVVDGSPSEDERLEAERAVRDRYRGELEAAGFEGDVLDGMVDRRMRSVEGLQAVGELAGRLHADADVSVEDEGEARSRVYHERAVELERAGFKGEALKREMDKYMDSDMARERMDVLAREQYERRVYGEDMRLAVDGERARLRAGFEAQGLRGERLAQAVEEALGSDGSFDRIRGIAHASHAGNLLAGLSGGLSDERRESVERSDWEAAWIPTGEEMSQAFERVRRDVSADEVRRLKLARPELDEGSDEFRTVLDANVDRRMRGLDERVREEAGRAHHDEYMRRMGERVDGLDVNARRLFDERLDAECDRLMGEHPELSVAEVRERACENLYTESNLADVERRGVRRALALMDESVQGDDGDVFEAARVLGVSASGDMLSAASDVVRERFVRGEAERGLSGDGLERRVDALMDSDSGRLAVRAEALRMDPRVAARAAMMRGDMVDRATVRLMQSGVYGDAAGARAAAIMQNRLTSEFAARGLSGKELDDRVVSMMADPNVRERVDADAAALRADPRQTVRFDRMFDEANATVRGRYESARLSGSGVLPALVSSVSRDGGVVSDVVSSSASAVGTLLGPAAAHPLLTSAAAAMFAPAMLPAVAGAAVLAHTTLNGRGFVNRTFRNTVPAVVRATRGVSAYASFEASSVGEGVLASKAAGVVRDSAVGVAAAGVARSLFGGGPRVFNAIPQPVRPSMVEDRKSVV